MFAQDSQCASFYTQVGSSAVDVSLVTVQGVVSFLSTIASVLIILSYVAFQQLRTTSRFLIVHLAVANFMVTMPNFMSVFMNFRERFKLPVEHLNITNTSHIINFTSLSLACSENGLLNHTSHVYCQVCVFQAFVNIFGVISSIFWTVCVCIHFFILVMYRNPKRASRIAYVYYVIAWLVPLGISLWLLFHNWLGFEPTYSTVNCAIRTQCVPHHHPYHYNTGVDEKNWNRTIGALFGLKIWQALALLIIPFLYIAIKLKNKKRKAKYSLYSSSTLIAPIKDVERKIMLVPFIFMLMCSASFVCDMYFFIKHGGLKGSESNSVAIILVHLLIILSSKCSDCRECFMAIKRFLYSLYWLYSRIWDTKFTRRNITK
ncbi:G-protein coupled receptor 157-like isoform X2 [Dysidea avara]|uniref:G-protein coupled receptor 157-like isoform X2 n=1 Tax=Dysidea avara TaxID=196820 RepID=UPI0033243869